MIKWDFLGNNDIFPRFLSQIFEKFVTKQWGIYLL